MSNLPTPVFDLFTGPPVFEKLKQNFFIRHHKLSYKMWYNLMVCWNFERERPVRAYTINDVRGSLLFLHRKGLIDYGSVTLDDGSTVKSTRISDEGLLLMQHVLQAMAKIYPEYKDWLNRWGMEPSRKV